MESVQLYHKYGLQIWGACHFNTRFIYFLICANSVNEEIDNRNQPGKSAYDIELYLTDSMLHRS